LIFGEINKTHWYKFIHLNLTKFDLSRL